MTIFYHAWKGEVLTAWNVSVFGVFLIRFFLQLDWIQSDTEYRSVFSLVQVREILEILEKGVKYVQSYQKKHQNNILVLLL